MSRVKTHDDHGEFARLMERWGEPILRLCVRMTGNVHRGEDLKQECFLRLFEKRKDYQPPHRFSTWLWRIALNLCYDELRRQARRRQVLSEGEPADADGQWAAHVAEEPTPDMRAVELEEGELVRRALLLLTEAHRTVLVLRHYEGLKLAQIAEVLEIPEGTVNSRMAEALARLSRLLEPSLRPKLKPSVFSSAKSMPVPKQCFSV